MRTNIGKGGARLRRLSALSAAVTLGLSLVTAGGVASAQTGVKPIPRRPVAPIAPAPPKPVERAAKPAIVEVTPTARGAELGEVTRVPVTIIVSNPTATAQKVSLRMEGRFARTTVTPVTTLAANSRRTFTQTLQIDLTDEKNKPGSTLGFAVALQVDGKPSDTHKFTLKTQRAAKRSDSSTTARPTPVDSNPADFDVGFRSGRVTKLFTTAHVRRHKRRVTGGEFEMVVKNNGKNEWNAPLELHVTATTIKRDGRRLGQTYVQTANLTEAIAPGQTQAWSIQLGTKRPNVVAVVRGGPAGAPAPKIVFPKLVYKDAWPIEKGDRFEIRATLQSPHDTDTSTNQLVVTGELLSDLSIHDQTPVVGAAPRTTGNTSVSTRPSGAANHEAKQK